jgi:ATPase subunit of ABC transporter with duplicated ATPase domains
MSATLQATGLAAGHGDRMLFSGLDLVVVSGDVVGLVGANGAGKSTLLRLLAGKATPQDGTVALSPADATVGHLPQEPERRPGETVWAFLARRTGVAQAQSTMDTAAQALAAGGPDYYSAALDRWLAANLGLGVDLATPMTALSGGQAARTGLAALLLSATTCCCSMSPPTILTSTGWNIQIGGRETLRLRCPTEGVGTPISSVRDPGCITAEPRCLSRS